MEQLPDIAFYTIKWEVRVAGLNRDEAVEFAYLSLITDPDLVVFTITDPEGETETVALATLLKELKALGKAAPRIIQ